MNPVEASLPHERRTRNPSVDIIKIIAMIMISYYHIGYSRLDYGFTPGQDNYMPNFSRIVMNLCAMGVPLFFIAAGYLTISRKYTARKIFLKILTIAVLATLWNYITPIPVWFLITLSGLYLIQPIIHFLQEKHPTLYSRC